MIIHIVKPEETLYSIATLYNSNAQYLADENGLDIEKNLVVGQSIVIPQDEPKLGKIAVTGYLYPYIDEQILKETLPYLTFANVFSYGFNRDGSLVDIDDDKVLSIIKEQNVAPVMVLSTIDEENGFNSNLSNVILNDEKTQDILIENVLKKMREKGYFGLDIDFEYILEKDRDAFSNFVKKITTILNANNYPVSVSLAPKTDDNQKGILYEAHDYEQIGKNANSVFLMTYEWGYTYGEPMAVAPIDKVEEVLIYATSVIESYKIVMGVPNYGYDWTLPFVKGQTKAKSIGNAEAIDIARENGATILFDEEAKTPYFTYTKDGVEHIVYFEDARSIYAKLGLVTKFKLAGIGYWNIMRFFKQGNVVVSQLFDVYKIKG